MRNLILLLLAVFFLHIVPTAFAESPGWRRAKNAADDIIYAGKDRTLYCGCVYASDGDSDGSGSVDHQACGYLAHRAILVVQIGLNGSTSFLPHSCQHGNSIVGTLETVSNVSVKTHEHRP